MITECPQCTQRIDLGGSNLTSFACPNCNTPITLKVSVAAGMESTAQSENAYQELQPLTPPSTSAGQGMANKKVKSGFNLIGWLVGICIVGPLLGKCAQKVIAPDYDPDKLKSYFEPYSPEADREQRKRSRRIIEKLQEHP